MFCPDDDILGFDDDHDEKFWAEVAQTVDVACRENIDPNSTDIEALAGALERVSVNEGKAERHLPSTVARILALSPSDLAILDKR